jgi:hypothetical protein
MDLRDRDRKTPIVVPVAHRVVVALGTAAILSRKREKWIFFRYRVNHDIQKNNDKMIPRNYFDRKKP